MSRCRNPCPDPAAACGCCEGTESVTPESTANRPGLAALAYRVGTHSSFLETMKARLSSHCLGEDCDNGGGTRPLAALTTRDDSDPSIALLDAWATVGDVLTFYQERIANEGYLRTARERRSVLELSRLIGYEPRPGVAASVWLAYTIDENTGEEVLIPAGARAQSVPGPDETPQSFETREDLEARAAWNRLLPRQTVPQQWHTVVTKRKLYLKGIATNLKANDPLLIDPGEGKPQLFRVMSVNADGEADRTGVEIAPWTWTADEAGSESVRRVAKELIESAPQGKTADRLVENFQTLREIAERTADTDEIIRYIDGKTMPLLRSAIEATRGPAPRLKPWMALARAALTKVREALGRDAASPGVDTSFSGRLNTLIKQPSRPLANSLQLPRTLKSSFGPTSDAGLQTLGLASPSLGENLSAAIASYSGASPKNNLAVYALRLKVGVFGRNAQKKQRTTKNGEVFETETIGEWPIVDVRTRVATESEQTVFLDNSYEGILPGSWLVLDSSAVTVFGQGTVLVEPAAFPEHPRHSSDNFPKYLVVQARGVANKVARAQYGMSGDSTSVDLSEAWLRFTSLDRSDETRAASTSPLQAVYDRDFQVVRGTAVYAQSELLELAEAPVETEVCDGASEHAPLELDGLYRDLEPGRFLVVSGERSDIADTRGVLAAEAVMIAAVTHDVSEASLGRPLRAPGSANDPEKERAPLPGDRTHTFISLDQPLSYCYRRESLKIYGNVVKATHGESRNETLGGGDGSKALQSFTLKQSPLTYLAAPTAVGAESTLSVFVNDVRWHEQPRFVDSLPTDHVYITRTDDDGKTSITFGNGREGARLPTGIENVKATYRYGIGKSGNVRAEQVTLLSTRPLGVKEVTNPLRASGGADRETRDQARRNAPLAVRSLDRLVSTTDYADFARNFAGIAKADAVELSDGRHSVVHVTIAGNDDIPIDTGSDLFVNLRRALTDLGDPFQPVRLAWRDLLLLVISAGVRIDPDHRWESVVTELRARLYDTFGFERRELALDVTASEVLSAMQSVRGVLYVDLDAFGAVPSMIADPDAEDGRRPLTPDETAAEIAQIVGHAPEPRVLALPAQATGSGITPAQLAVLVPEVPATLVINQVKD